VILGTLEHLKLADYLILLSLAAADVAFWWAVWEAL
jgi:hypothetical protein